MSIFFYIVLGLSIVLNIILLIGVRNLVLQTEDYESRLQLYRTYVTDKIESALKALKDADIKGSFESDDEVGSVFEDMKDIINKMNETPF
jgi:hypothetical protein